MNKKIKLSIGLMSGFFMLFSFFSTTTPALAATCTSATLTGTVVTGTPPTHARFAYGTSYSAVANGQGVTTPVQYFYNEGTFPIQQYISNLTESTTYYYRLEVTNNYGTENLNIESFTTSACTVVTPAPTVTISVPGPVGYNGSSTIVWSSTNATSCTASGDWNGPKSISGSQSTGTLTSDKTYTLTCTGAGGTASNSATINVGAQPVLTPTVSLTASPTSVSYGGTSYLSWTSTNATSCTASNGVNNWAGSKGLSGSFYTGVLNNTTTYNIVCNNSTTGLSANDSATITVGSQPISLPTVSITADNTNLTYNGSTYLRWTSTNATSCMASEGSNGWSGSRNTSGIFYTGALTNSVGYRINCSNNAGTMTDYVVVNVNAQPISSPIVSLTADNTNLTYNGSTYLRWTSTNATSCVGTNFSTNNATSGNFYTGALTGTMNYSIVCTGTGGTISDSEIVTVGSQPISNPTVSLTADNTNVTYGNSTYLRWTSTNATSCFGTNFNTNNAVSGSYYTGALTGTTTYSITCTNNSSSATSSTTVSTSGNNYYDCNYYNNCYVNRQPLVTTYSASVTGNNSAVLNGYIDPNNSYASRWFEYGTNYSYLYSSTGKIYQGTSSGNFNESIYNLNPNTIYYFRAAAQGSTGQIVYGNTLSFTTTGSNYIYNSCVNGTCAPVATTIAATNIGQSSARVHGLASVYNSVYTTGYFEYGTTQNLGSITTNKSVGSTSSSAFYDSLFNLASNTTYYYRAVISNQYGISRGNILAFTTNNPTTYVETNTNTRTIYRNTTVVTNTNDTTGTSKPSLVFLSVSKNGETIRKGDTIEYIISYKNVSTKNLKDVVLQIFIPKGLEFRETSRGTYSSDRSVIVANIGNLNSQEEGNVRITVTVSTDPEINKVVVVTANLAYTIVDTNTQEEVFAYSKNNVIDEMAIQQGALALLFGNGFLPNNLIGWLLLILLIVLLILAARKAYYGHSTFTVDDNLKKEH